MDGRSVGWIAVETVRPLHDTGRVRPPSPRPARSSPTIEGKGVLDVGQAGRPSTVGIVHRDDVSPETGQRNPLPAGENAPRKQDPAGLGGGDGLKGGTEAAGSPGFDLYDDKPAPLLHEEIGLPASYAVVPRQDAVPVGFEIAAGQGLSFPGRPVP